MTARNSEAKPDDADGAPGYYTAQELARVIVILSAYAPVNLAEDVGDCVAWAAALVFSERKPNG